MHKNSIDRISGDRKGIAIAAICFVHCVAGPVLLSFAGLASLTGLSEQLEPAFYAASAALGAATLIPAYRKRHRKISCLVLFLAGMLCLFGHRHIQRVRGPLELAAVALGGGLIIGAHTLNLRYSKRCACCQPLAEEPDVTETAF